jgi:hypothetical protein
MGGVILQADYVRRRARCGECGKRMRKGEVSLLYTDGAKVVKRVCGEACRTAYEVRCLPADGGLHRGAAAGTRYNKHMRGENHGEET